MKKIGILTWHYLENYGSALQSYAMQYLCSKNGENVVKIINYRKDARDFFGYRFLRCLKNEILLPFSNSKKRVYSFQKFHKKYLNQTKLLGKGSALKRIGNKFDIYVCGSDQIWSPNVFDETYFLDFVDEKKTRASYAPSVVIDNYSEEQKQKVALYIKKFSFLSCREPMGVDIIQKISGIKGQDVLDPTLLVPVEHWKTLADEKCRVEEPYLLCYLIGDKKEHRKMIKDVADSLGLKVVCLPFKEWDKQYGDYNLDDVGPSQFLTLIDNAELVCTDSFHGMLFSINFKKEFLVFSRFDENDPMCQNERVDNILKKADLESRLVKEKWSQRQLEDKIDYLSVEKKLESYRKASMEYLEEII